MKCEKKRVLVVEDSVDIQALLNQLYVSEGYEVFKAYNGEEALAILLKERIKPCMILLDIMMPIMDGLEFRQKQIADQDLSNIPVVIMTADRDIENHAKNAQVKSYLKKPVNIQELLKITEHYCGNPKDL